MSDIRFIAKQYIDAGWAVVPLVSGEKRANSSWQKRVYGSADFNSNDGIAGKCGEPSGWRVDVDCDAPEAVAAAKLLLPDTGLIHGRPGKPDSHYWFICEHAKTAQFTDIKSSAGGPGKDHMLVEIRSTGGYTVLPPSGHPSGDTLSWSQERAPLQIDAEGLYAAVRDVAIAALLARHWPGPGARHDAVGPLTGLLGAACDVDLRVLKVIEVAATVAGDPDLHDRQVFARSTLKKLRAGERVTGGPKLIEHFGEHVVAKLRSWLRLADADALEDMNARHFVVRLGKDEVIATEEDGHVIFQLPSDLKLRYANRHVNAGVNSKTGEPRYENLFEYWLKARTRREYRTVTFSPPPSVPHPLDYNLWTGFALEAKPGDCPKLLTHLRDVICGGNDDHARYLCKLLAWSVQHPGRPGEIATVIRGEPGTGKGVFIRALMQIFGRHAIQLDRPEQLTGHFNAHLSAKCLVFADEAFWAGDKKEAGSLKRLITEPTLTVTRKGIDSVAEQNCVHLFMATNENWAVPAMLKERRFFCLNVSNAMRGNFKYFSDLVFEMDHGGLAAFLDLLLSLKVTHEEILQVPKTQELRVQQTQSLPNELKWWQYCLQEGKIGLHSPWPERVSNTELYDVYRVYADIFKWRLVEPIEFSRRMSDLLSPDGKTVVMKSKGKATRTWRLFTLEDARLRFDRELGTQTEWQESLGDEKSSGTIPF